jgi:two-component system response regulator CpxR
MTMQITSPENSVPRVLITDDDRELCRMLTEYLAVNGFEGQAVHDGAAAVEEIRNHPLGYSIVVLDITMPGMDGFETLRQLRRQSTVPVIMLTARGDDTDRIVGLELGADDYLPKPFNPRELIARLRAVLRRAQPVPGPDGRLLEAGDLQLDLGARELRAGGVPITITSTEFGIIETLMRRAGEVVDKDQLSRLALGRHLTPFDRSLDTHVGNLRKKLGAAPSGVSRIRTVRAKGYVLTTG